MTFPVDTAYIMILHSPPSYSFFILYQKFTLISNWTFLKPENLRTISLYNSFIFTIRILKTKLSPTTQHYFKFFDLTIVLSNFSSTTKYITTVDRHQRATRTKRYFTNDLRRLPGTESHMVCITKPYYFIWDWFL